MPSSQIKHLSIEYCGRYAAATAVGDVGFDPGAGAVFGLVGETGADKFIVGKGYGQLPVSQHYPGWSIPAPVNPGG